jgi:quinol monooxygenase YgiN
MILLYGVRVIRPGFREDAIRELKAVRSGTLAEEGCQGYHFSFDIDDQNVVRIFEEWRDRECLLRHLDAPHLRAFAQAATGLFDGAPTTIEYRISSKSVFTL